MKRYRFAILFVLTMLLGGCYGSIGIGVVRDDSYYYARPRVVYSTPYYYAPSRNYGSTYRATPTRHYQSSSVYSHGNRRHVHQHVAPSRPARSHRR